MTKQIKIDIPKGYVIDKENSTFEVIKFKKAEKKLPTSWKELRVVKGYYITDSSKIKEYLERTKEYNKNIFPTKELAEATLALAQLLQLREAYNDGWQPDWENSSEIKYVIHTSKEKLHKDMIYNWNKVLTFKTPELRNKFFENFKDLLEVAKPLL